MVNMQKKQFGGVYFCVYIFAWIIPLVQSAAFMFQVDEYGREVYKLVKQFTNMARKEKDMKEKASKDTVRRKKQDTQEAESDDVFAPLKVAQAIQNQIKDFKVARN